MIDLAQVQLFEHKLHKYISDEDIKKLEDQGVLLFEYIPETKCTFDVLDIIDKDVARIHIEKKP